MQAIIYKDPYDPPCDDLEEHLQKVGIEYFYIKSLTELKDAVKKLNPKLPFLFYRNSLMRMPLPELILKWHEENPECKNVAVPFKNIPQLVSFYPEQIEVLRDIVTTTELKEGNNSNFVIQSIGGTKIEITLKKPKTKPLFIFVKAFNRPEYLKLSLNSLLYSIGNSTPVLIFLNGFDAKTCEVALSYAEKYSNVDVIRIRQNVHFAYINIALQWSRAENFMIWEDDFILPPIARELFPYWPSQFVHRLKHFDLVGWGPITENIPEWHPWLGNRFPRTDYPYNEWVYCDTEAFQGKKHWEISSQVPLLLAQGLAMNVDFWSKCQKHQPWFAPKDSDYHSNAKNYCLPGLRGYHIGWNQEMDGYINVEGPREIPIENVVSSLKTGRTEIIKLDAI
jgi:hypothetical protein